MVRRLPDRRVDEILAGGTNRISRLGGVQNPLTSGRTEGQFNKPTILKKAKFG